MKGICVFVGVLFLTFCPLPWVATAGTEEELDKQLIKAAERRDIAQVKTLLDEGANVDTKDRVGMTGLIMTVCKSDKEDATVTDMAKILLEYRAEINAADRCGRTALYWARTTVISTSHDSFCPKALT